MIPQPEGKHDFQEEDGNFGDTISRCQRCGVHKGSPAGNAPCDAHQPASERLAGNALLQFESGKEPTEEYVEALRQALLKRNPEWRNSINNTFACAIAHLRGQGGGE